MTFSVGIAVAIPHNPALDTLTGHYSVAVAELLAAADRALYAAKQQGRNRWVVAP